MSISSDRLLETAKQAAGLAASTLREQYAVDAGVISAGGKDLKTAADLAAEKQLLNVLSETGYPVVSEESADTHQALTDGELKWIVDPLDGTLNFTRGLPFSCVSVSLWAGQRPVLGVIENLAQKIQFYGVVGGVAREGSRMLAVSQESEVSQAVIATGFPSGASFETEQIEVFVAYVQAFKKVRLLGSAALSLAYVATGALDAYCEKNIWLWDVAAGLSLVLAAGGCYWMTPPNAEGQVTVFASNGLIRPPEALLLAHEDLEKYIHP